MDTRDREPKGMVVGVVRFFLTGPTSIIVIAAAALMGMVALLGTPQEEEPQIVVPMADVLVDAPGLSPAEVEEQVTRPLERILWQVKGVEHVYSTSRRDQSVVTVRFFVGQDRERSIINLRDQIESHRDIVPPAVRGWVVKPVQIDDVPVVQLTLYGEGRDPYELHRIAGEVKARLDGIEDLSRSELFGGLPREILVEPDIEAMAARNICMADIAQALRGGNPDGQAGDVVRDGTAMTLRPAETLRTADDVRATVIRSPQGLSVRVGDVADVRDGPGEPVQYHHVRLGPADTDAAQARDARLPAVTLAFAKKPGADASAVARRVIASAEALRGTVIPSDIALRVTRNYGATANEKVNNLLSSMAFAILTVVALLAFTMGWRESMIVGVSVPISFALALFVNYVAGYSINRVTLFALILSLGLVVDDPITNVDNIQRHIREGLRKPFLATQWAVHEMVVPVIMSTLTIIMSFLPMFFITGMMGPYMRPMAINVPLAVSFSTVCALTFVPWLAYRLLKHRAGDTGSGDATPGWVRAGYRAVMEPLLDRRRGRLLLVVIAVLFVLSGMLVPLRQVPLKMLPFDNRDELQLVLDMPEGSTLEQTDRVCQELEDYLVTVNEVRDCATYTGINSPIDFNGLVRHYAFRRHPHNAEIRINLASKDQRKQQSHAIGLRLRDDLTAIATRHGAVLSIVETPPGPPVLSTLVAEVYGAPELSYDQLIAGARELERRMTAYDPKHIAQVDDMAESARLRMDVVTDADKAIRHGLTPLDIGHALQAATWGIVPGAVHAAHERDPLLMRVRLPYAARVSHDRLGQLWLRTREGGLVQLAELASFAEMPEDQPVYRKDLERVVFVTAECVGRPPGEIVLALQRAIARNPLPAGIGVKWAGEGEWQVTVDVFRDLGIAFGVALVGIYLLLVFQTGSFSMPGIIMLAIPLTAIGILPGFWLLNVLAARSVGGYPSPVFFTATAMIGMIALGGIVIRNSIVLIEFVQQGMAAGMSLREALLDSGAVRFRPIMLTALTTLLGVWPITLDPIFNGLAWALIFGLFASTLFTMVVIPTVYWLLYAPPASPSNGASS